ncbi:hypothetical protein GCK32_021230, partial [Trichostrongylus colubriformis]
VLFNLITYSQTFYVCIWRSTEHRIAFKQQLLAMLFRAPVSSTLVTATLNPSKIITRISVSR